MERSNRVVSHAAGAILKDDRPSSMRTSDLSMAFFPSDQFVRAFNNFKKSSAPSRFLLFLEEEWVDVAAQVFEELAAGFLAGKTALEVAVHGKNYLFDFIGMSRIDAETGGQNSLAWIDVHGRCFFPAHPICRFGFGEKRTLGRFRAGSDYPEVLSDVNAEEVSSNRWPDAKLLNGDDRFYKLVEKLFLLSGIKKLMPTAFITSIHRCSHSSPGSKFRLASFQLRKKAMTEARGNANVKFGWYGTSASEMYALMSSGFTKPNNGQLAAAAHGVGLHLSSPHFPCASALLSEADEEGERHVVLCRVIMGKSEIVEPGSTQDRPSDEAFDSGVDDATNPKWLVVWRSDMNSRIIPEYIVSFKTSGHCHGRRATVGHKPPSGLGLSFSKLFVEMGRILPSSKMHALELLHDQYKGGKRSKESFVRQVRSIAGDRLLSSTIKRLR
ncbi:hypothetical protein HPP92_005750 [Vanilla planifolia]|uniref:Poly [ADP-ribose] polymerase n=1 Tax=Vanilla planifolia TaxID=51239 RepID=A0A835VFQ0_VANPL|nr:hypothetical protein HPP92_005750 [Vanilla planifolia]